MSPLPSRQWGSWASPCPEQEAAARAPWPKARRVLGLLKNAIKMMIKQAHPSKASKKYQVVVCGSSASTMICAGKQWNRKRQEVCDELRAAAATRTRTPAGAGGRFCNRPRERAALSPRAPAGRTLYPPRSVAKLKPMPAARRSGLTSTPPSAMSQAPSPALSESSISYLQAAWGRGAGGCSAAPLRSGGGDQRLGGAGGAWAHVGFCARRERRSPPTSSLTSRCTSSSDGRGPSPCAR